MIEIAAAINSASAAGQCYDRESISKCLIEVVRALTVLLPKLLARTAILAFDHAIEARSLGLGEPISASLNHIRDKQTTRQWFLYTRNRARNTSTENRDYSVTSSAGQSTATVPSEIVENCSHWISFAGAANFRCGRLSVKSVEQEWSLLNAERADTVARWLPRYEPSPKHKPYEYGSANGPVARMDLSDELAGEVLTQSIAESESLRFGTRADVFYAFRLTRVDNEQSVFHGYVVVSGEIPSEILTLLRARL